MLGLGRGGQRQLRFSTAMDPNELLKLLARHFIHLNVNFLLLRIPYQNYITPQK